MHRLAMAVVFMMLSMTLAGSAQNPPARGPSTPEERARLVAIAHKLEAAPLDPSLKADRQWAILWLIQVPDLTVSLCPNVLGKDYLKTKYKYSPELTGQLTLSSAAFIIEHPDKASDKLAQYTAGAEGALKAYGAILKDNPKAKYKALDEAVARQEQGQLADFVRENSGSCK
jgi:hypothetical protein